MKYKKVKTPYEIIKTPIQKVKNSVEVLETGFNLFYRLIKLKRIKYHMFH